MPASSHIKAATTAAAAVDSVGAGDADLYTPEYCTTFKIWENRLTYIRIRYYMPNRNYVHHAIFTNEIIQIIIHQTIILHGKQEYCTSQNKGILYITEIRNIVHHRKQEYCTSLKSGILYITEKKEFCTTQKTGILYNTEIRNIVHHWYAEECEWALCCCTKFWCMSA